MGLKEKLQHINRHPEPESFDRVKELALWLEVVNGLYADVETWLAEYVQNGLMKLTRERVERDEELLGAYVIERMRIGVGPEAFYFDPVGRFVVGGEGRVDLYKAGMRGKGLMLIRAHEENGAPYWLIREEGVIARVGQPIRRWLSKRQLEDILDSWL